VAVSWSTPAPVGAPAVEVGTDAGLGLRVPAETRVVRGWGAAYHHARVEGLEPGTVYRYRISHAGGPALEGTFRTAPASVEPFGFVALGDQGTSAAADAVNARIRALDPAFVLHAGDLCYANTTGNGEAGATDQAVWDRWLGAIAPQASRAPWMPTVGNHEMEPGYGELGYDGFAARFTLPANGAPGAPHTWWFRWGNLAVVGADANDASFEIPHNLGWLGPAQDRWLDETLGRLRADPAVDFLVVVFHHCAYCSNAVHASDGGVRSRWAPIFDRHGVDLVVNGHNHSYERTHPVRGAEPVGEAPTGATIDSATGTTYLTAGGGGQQSYPVTLYPASYVTVEGGARVPEAATWSAVRLLDYSLLAVDVTPAGAGGLATMHLRGLRPDGTVFDEVTLARRAPARRPASPEGRTAGGATGGDGAGAAELPASGAPEGLATAGAALAGAGLAAAALARRTCHGD
jgi:3',5'-cyclic AMP phosphodiesterase CpdA